MGWRFEIGIREKDDGVGFTGWAGCWKGMGYTCFNVIMSERARAAWYG